MSEISKLDRNLIIRKIDSETINIQITNNTMLMSIVGQFDQNLKELEKLTNTVIFFRGNSITAKGDQESILNVSNSLKFLVNKFLITNLIEKNDIIYSVKNGMSEMEEKNRNNIRPLDQVMSLQRM